MVITQRAAGGVAKARLALRRGGVRVTGALRSVTHGAGEVGGHTPRMWRPWIPLVVMPLAAALVLAGVVWGLTALSRGRSVSWQDVWPLDLEIAKVALTVVAFLGAVLAGVYAYRKQRLSEGDARRADAAAFADRYVKAADQLGATHAAIRLAGVYAMARLADDWPVQRQVCIDVLCAYLRMPYTPDLPPDDPRYRPGETEVRQTIVRAIAVRLRRQSPVPWSCYDLDLTGAVLEEADFTDAVFSGVARFAGVTFTGEALFADVTLAQDVEFGGATFSGPAWFQGATFAGEASFTWATFSEAAWFAGATFEGNAGFGGTTFAREVGFHGVSFAWTSWFADATFSGPAAFADAKFSDDAELPGATFIQSADFDGAAFSKIPDLSSTVFVKPDVVKWGPLTPS